MKLRFLVAVFAISAFSLAHAAEQHATGLIVPHQTGLVQPHATGLIVPHDASGRPTDKIIREGGQLVILPVPAPVKEVIAKNEDVAQKEEKATEAKKTPKDRHKEHAWVKKFFKHLKKSDLISHFVHVHMLDSEHPMVMPIFKRSKRLHIKMTKKQAREWDLIVKMLNHKTREMKRKSINRLSLMKRLHNIAAVAHKPHHMGRKKSR